MIVSNYVEIKWNPRNKNIYIEKSTGKLWDCVYWFIDHNGKFVRIREYDDNDRNTEITLKGSEFEEKFVLNPWPKPEICIEDVKPRHLIHIILRCPECGSILNAHDGVLLTSPLQYEHKCSNPECKYETCISSYYSGMFAAVTDEQEKKIMNGVYNEITDGKIFQLKENNLW